MLAQTTFGPADLAAGVAVDAEADAAWPVGATDTRPNVYRG